MRTCVRRCVCVYNMKEGQKRRKTKSQKALCLRKNQRNLVIHLHEQHVRRKTNITDSDIHIHFFFLFVIKILFPVNMVCGLDFVCTGVCV